MTHTTSLRTITALALGLVACESPAPTTPTTTDATAQDTAVADLGADVGVDRTVAPDATADDAAVDAPPSMDRPVADVTLDAPPARNPLGLMPGVAVTRPLGPIEQPGMFDLRSRSAEIDYAVDLAAQRFVVRLPARFDPRDGARRYGLVTFIDAADEHAFPSTYAAALDAHDMIWIGAQGVGNAQSVRHRVGVALLGALRMSELYNVDPARVYTSGLSGGSRSAGSLAYLRQDVFRGFVGRVGAALPAVIPGWQTAGTGPGDLDADYELMLGGGLPPVTLPVHVRTALTTQYGDFRRSEIAAIYRYGHLNHGNAVRFIMRPGGHGDEVAANFEDALNYLDHPALDVIWDRFEDQNLGLNTDPGRTVAGSGFVGRGDVRELRAMVLGSPVGVLQLAGDGAEAEARETFTWRDAYGIEVDARLRAETAAGDNQQIGMHVVPVGATGDVGAAPGLHVLWSYGAPSAAAVVAADGTRTELAQWTFASPHPLNLPTMAVSPQSGEGTVVEKTFWNAREAPDAAAGATLRFRGEDLHLVLSAVGFQLTFNRPATGLVTPFAGRVVLGPSGDGEELPIVLQGFWSEVATAAIAGLPSGRWRLVFTDRAVASGRPAGNAWIDEVHLVGTVGTPAAPPSLRAQRSTTPAGVTLQWTAVSGAASYEVWRAAGPGEAVRRVGTVAGYVPRFTDTEAADARTVWQVAAVGRDGATGPRSATASVTP